MNVKQLKKELEKYPDNLEVMVAERMSEFAFGLVNSVEVKDVRWLEDVDDSPNKDTPVTKCLIISEE